MAVSSTLTRAQWRRIEPLLPPYQGRGRRRADDRKVLNGILYVLKSGCRWCDMPRRYGSYVTAWRRLKRWMEDGTWERIQQALLQELDEQGKIDWAHCSIDGSYVRAKGAVRRQGAREGA